MPTVTLQGTWYGCLRSYCSRASGGPFLNFACFADPGDQHLGKPPRYFGFLRPDSIRNLDAAMRKEFAVTERAPGFTPRRVQIVASVEF